METKIKHPISGQPVDVAKIVLTDDNATGHELYAINYGSQPVYRKTIAINVDNVHGYESFEHNAQYCEPLTIALIPLDGYQALPWNTKVTMDGEDVTSAVFDVATNSINITEVTGDISIEAEAVEMSSDYEPVEYIHVDTATSNSIITLWGCMANSNSKLELDVKLKDVQGLLFGTRNTTNASASAPNYFAFIRYGSGTASNTVGFMCFGKNQQASSVNNLLIGQRFKFVANKNVWTYKRRIGIDYTHTFGSQDAWSNDYAIRIFGHYNGAQYYGAGTIYGIVYSEEDARQHKYVPVRKLADGRCGLYDVADNVSSRYNQVSTSYITPYIDIIPTSTFTNCTTTLLSDAITGTATKAVIGSTWSIKITPTSGYTFTGGIAPLISFDGIDVSSDTSKVTITNNGDDTYTLTILNVPDCAIGISATAVLPYDSIVEYIKSDGNAYIELPVSAAAGDDFGCTFDIILHTTATQRVLISSNSTSSVNQYRMQTYSYTSNTNTMVLATTVGGSASGGGISVIIDERQSIVLSTSYANANALSRPLTSSFTKLTTPLVGTKMTFYGITIVKNNNTVYDLIPVRKNGAGYLYNAATKELFGNANSSGAFTYGNDVSAVQSNSLLSGSLVSPSNTPDEPNDLDPIDMEDM